MSRSRGVAVGACVAIACAPAAACAIDFDRFDPVDAGVAHETAPPETTSGTPEGMPSDSDGGADAALPDQPEASHGADATFVDATFADVARDAKGPQVDAVADGPSPCSVPPPSCINQAQSCAAACAQTEQQCMQNCGHNCNRCTSQGQSCAGGCTTSCVTCVHQAGCSDNGECSGGIDAGNAVTMDAGSAG